MKSILHPLESLGVVTASRGDIRAEKLEDRLQPKVPFPHRHEFFQLVFIFRSQGHHEIDFVRHKVHTGDVYIIKPGQVHTWQLSADTRGCVVEFYLESLRLENFEREVLQLLYESPDLIRGAKDLEEWMQLCEEMRREFRQDSEGRSVMLKSLLQIMLVRLLRQSPQSKKTVVIHPLLRDLEMLIEKHHRQEHAVAFYAGELKLSPKALTMRVQRLIAKSVKDLIQERSLLEARRYLGYSKLSVTEIAELLGYTDANYFTRLFRLKTGVSPLRFRTRNKTKGTT